MDKDTLKIKEVNSGAYWFNTQALISILGLIENNNAQNEYYLTDAIRLLISKGKKVGSFASGSSDLVLGANDPAQLHSVNSIPRKKIIDNLIDAGVEIPCSEGVTIGPDVRFGTACKILPETVIIGKSEIGNKCKIGPGVFLEDRRIEDGSVITKDLSSSSR